jgi:LPXTG-motif cell wall-anchored protein
VSSPAPSIEAVPSAPAADAYWRGWPEVRGDLRSAVAIAVGFALAGVLAGLVWWLLAPRADFRITGDGPVPLGGPSDELFVADDAVLAFVLLGLGLVGGATVWFLRRRRGVGALIGIAVGALVAAVVAWQAGELLGAGPTEAQLADVGAVVTTALRLGSPTVLAVAPFAGLLAYLVAVLCSRDDSLGRTAGPAPRGAVDDPLTGATAPAA